MDRNKIIIKTSIIGIIVNFFLSVFKAVVGFLSGSIAIVLDAVNNLSDAASSTVTIVGAKLANKKADRTHPFGHGRVEYISAVIISELVLYAGITSFIEACKKIINPQVPEYTLPTLIIVITGVIVKIILGFYVTKIGRSVNSDSLINSGKDATLDSVISASTILAAVIFMLTGLSFEAWLGAIISLIIIKSGFDMLKETVSRLLGERVDYDFATKIKTTVLSFPNVSGVYDLVLNNYGPDNYSGSLHIEIPDTYSAEKIDDLTRKITEKVYKENDVILTAIGIYARNTKNDEAAKIQKNITEAVTNLEHVIQLHGFYLNNKKNTIRFDVLVSFDATDLEAMYNRIYNKVKALYPDFEYNIVLDKDFCES